MLTLEDLGVLRDVERGRRPGGRHDHADLLRLPGDGDDARRPGAPLRDHGFDDVEVRVSLHPAWSSDWITERGRARAGRRTASPRPDRLRRHDGPVAAQPAARRAARSPARAAGPRDVDADLGVRTDGLQGDVPLHRLPRAVRARQGDLSDDHDARASPRDVPRADGGRGRAAHRRLGRRHLRGARRAARRLRLRGRSVADAAPHHRRREEHRRSYSICAPAGARPRVGVREIPDGLFSSWLVRDVAAGDTVEVQTPTGSFRADPAQGGRHLCIAAGSGITPMLSIAVHACWPTPTTRR